jgi:hypothetical protein
MFEVTSGGDRYRLIAISLAAQAENGSRTPNALNDK